MAFLQDKLAVLSALYHTAKLGFTMLAKKKTQAPSQRSPIAMVGDNAQNHSHNNTEGSSLDVPQLRTKARWMSPLDICLNKNGAMTPFRSLFDDALLSSGTHDPESSAGASTRPEPETSLFAALSSSLHDGGAMESFHASIPVELLCPEPDISSAFSVIEGGVGSSIIDEEPISDTDGRDSPTSSLYSNSPSSGVSNSVFRSRSSSLATSVDMSREEKDASKLFANRTNTFARTGEPDGDPSVLPEGRYHQHVIKVALQIKYDTVSSHNATEEGFVQDACHNIKDEGDIRYESLDEMTDSDSSVLEVLAQGEASNAAEDSLPPPGEGASHLIDESCMLDESSMYEEDCGSSPPASPEEAAAWAHSHCPVNPGGTKMKTLKDHQGREFVLYHDCYHCLPKDLAPEFAEMFDEDDEDTGASEVEVVDRTSTTGAETTAVCPYDTDSEPCHSQSNDTATDPNPALEQTNNNSVRTHSDEVEQAIDYASPSDLCQGAWMLYKCEESDWYTGAFWDYFAEGMPPRFLRSQKRLTQKSPLSQVQSISDWSDDDTFSLTEAAIEVRSLPSEVSRGLQAEEIPHRMANKAEMTDSSPKHDAVQQEANSEGFSGPCGHMLTIDTITHDEKAVEKLLGCGMNRRDGLLADCRLATAEILCAEGSLMAGGDSRAKHVEDWAKTAWPAAWGAEVRLTEPDGRSCFLDTGETVVPCEYRGEKRSYDDDEE